MEVDLPEVAHRLSPQALEARRQVLGELLVLHQHRGEASLGHERMIEGQHHGALVDHVARWIAIGVIPQLTLWMAVTVVCGVFFGVLAVAVRAAGRPARRPLEA